MTTAGPLWRPPPPDQERGAEQQEPCRWVTSGAATRGVAPAVVRRGRLLDRLAIDLHRGDDHVGSLEVELDVLALRPRTLGREADAELGAVTRSQGQHGVRGV